ncbi:ATP-binding protein [Phaeobacter sp. PT47_59]|uniref:PAS domain-containing hybrid sensor histidine kinase/response regulator n=1 Tax=Phaeobacter sp. PT47_59 TaxID=3029979 RepID=UPI002380AF83|nr:ATP-binding protein [Phaeobacter sp. PT47_59]MDE4173031.1 ATP-binding protein [Phaeobacter sp. PT47_59]
MNEQRMSGNGPLTSHYRRFSSAGLFDRYSRGRIKGFRTRLVFCCAVSLTLAVLISPLVGVLSLLAVTATDLADCLYLRRARWQLRRDATVEARVRRISTVTAVLHAIGIGIGATAPIWAPLVPFGQSQAPEEYDQLFSMALLTGAAINVGLLFPFHRIAVSLRLIIYMATPVVVILIRGPVLGASPADTQLHIAGLCVFFGSLVWLLTFSTRNFHRTRSSLLAQALQRQELETAYQRLYAQQLETQRLALVARHANDSVMLLENSGKIIWVNDAFTRITGWRADEAIGREPGDLLNHPDTDPESLNAIVDGRTKKVPFRVQVLNRHKDGKEIWLETNQVPMLDDAGEVTTYIAVERDITEAKAYAATLEQARRAAEDGARAKSEFLATMSHEIRTPMNGVIGMAQLLEETELDGDQRLYAETILSSARTLLDLINDVLDLSKLNSGEVSIDASDFNPRQCFETTMLLLQSQADAKGLKLAFECDSAVPDLLSGDDRKLGQILTNLIGNAIKFTEAGQVTVTLEAQQRDDGADLTFHVTDTGIGICKEMQGKIFERFSQADAAISRRFGGTGLGLAICRRLATAMGGKIWVVSEPGKGSCFSVCLPFAEAEQDAGSVLPDTAGAAAKGAVAEALTGMRLLVAEDNRVNQILVQKFLKEAPIRIEFAADGALAVDRVQSFDPDIILMDMSMPVMDGLEATRAIRALPIRQPVIIALTANAFDTDKADCLEAGMDAFLTKPIDRPKLIEALLTHGQGARRLRAG